MRRKGKIRMKMRRKKLGRKKQGKRQGSAAISLVSTTANMGSEEKAADFIILRSALNSKRVDLDLTAAHGAGTAKISTKTYAEVRFRGSPVVDQRGPAISSIQDSKGMEMVVAESFKTATIF